MAKDDDRLTVEMALKEFNIVDDRGMDALEAFWRICAELKRLREVEERD